MSIQTKAPSPSMSASKARTAHLAAVAANAAHGNDGHELRPEDICKFAPALTLNEAALALALGMDEEAVHDPQLRLVDILPNIRAVIGEWRIPSQYEYARLWRDDREGRLLFSPVEYALAYPHLSTLMEERVRGVKTVSEVAE